MAKIDNCNKCIHKAVCSEKEFYIGYIKLVEDVPFISKFANVTINCNHYKEDVNKYKRVVTNDGEKELV